MIQWLCPHCAQPLAASRDGTVIAVGCSDKLINLWSLKDQKLLGTYRSAKYPVQQIHFSADGSRMLTIGWVEASKSFSIDSAPLPRVHFEIFDTASLEKRYECDLGRHVRSVAVSSDWRRVLLGDNDAQIYLWDLAAGREIAKLVGHQAAVTAVGLSPDGRFALSGSVDAWVILWGLPSDEKPPLSAAR
jgi:WD40 repeat protein